MKPPPPLLGSPGRYQLTSSRHSPPAAAAQLRNTGRKSQMKMGGKEIFVLVGRATILHLSRACPMVTTSALIDRAVRRAPH
jgi:hypothetical protein